MGLGGRLAQASVPKVQQKGGHGKQLGARNNQTEISNHDPGESRQRKPGNQSDDGRGHRFLRPLVRTVIQEFARWCRGKLLETADPIPQGLQIFIIERQSTNALIKLDRIP